MRTRGLLVALALPVALATACGSDSTTTAQDPSPTTASASGSPSDGAGTSASAHPIPAGPACAAVWKDGRTLPRGYHGCVTHDTWVTADGLGCSSGQKLVRYDDHYYAVLGGTIAHVHHLDSDQDYRATVARCRG